LLDSILYELDIIKLLKYLKQSVLF